MVIKTDLESGVQPRDQVATAAASVEPLLRRRDGGERLADANESLWLVLLSAAVAVCGSLEFGSCVGFSAPTQSGIRADIGLSLSQAMRIAAVFCIMGWLAVLFAQVGVGLMVFQQIGGINGIGFYASQIFVSAGFTSGNLGTILLGCIQVPITIVGAFLMDRSGRRALLMVSATGTFLGTFITATSFYFKGQGMLMQWTPVLALCGILVYVAAFSIGMGAVPWVIMSEIFPINVKGTGGSLVTLVNWFGSWLVSYTFNFLMDWSAAGTFFIFSAASIATVLFVFRLVPETKGRTLEEIHEFVNHDR